jgi:hypothetical protein
MVVEMYDLVGKLTDELQIYDWIGEAGLGFTGVDYGSSISFNELSALILLQWMIHCIIICILEFFL